VKTKLLCIALLALTAGCDKAPDNSKPADSAAADPINSIIVGKWAADHRTDGGLGNVLLFNQDRSMVSTFGALVDFRYEADGKTLKTTFQNPPKDGKPSEPTVQEEPYEIVDDKLIINPDDPKAREERTRVGQPKPGANPIVGVWSFKHYTGVPATWQYTTSGLAQLDVPMQTMKGHYEFRDDELTVDIDGQPSTTRKTVLAHDHLTLLPTSDKHEQRYTRVGP
jgi:hypothetical protein